MREEIIVPWVAGVGAMTVLAFLFLQIAVDSGMAVLMP